MDPEEPEDTGDQDDNGPFRDGAGQGSRARKPHARKPHARKPHGRKSDDPDPIDLNSDELDPEDWDDVIDGDDLAGALRSDAIKLLMTIRGMGLSNTDILSALERVPRHDFVSDVFDGQAYSDRPLPIACGQTISQPSLVASMTEALDVRYEHKVLEVGTGSGYQAAVLSLLVRRVYTLERYRSLAREAERRLNHLGFNNVTVRPGDGYRGWPELAPFDRIIVTAAAEKVPQTLVDQLTVGGVMVVPVGPEFGDQSLLRIVRGEDGVEAVGLGTVRFVPMVTGMADET